jgi:dihydroorotate dehydrogenase electron transfer subunit
VLNSQFFVLTFECEAISQTAQPGQFVNIACQQFLRRPFGILSVNPQEGTVQITLKPGDILSVLGPLGHGFDFAAWRHVLTVGGGTGVFPLYFVLERCRELGIRTTAVCGYRSIHDAVLADEIRATAVYTHLAAEDGKLDWQGDAILALQEVLADFCQNQPDVILTCGPKAMMQAVAEVARAAGLPCQVSLEERMGCGIGVCLGCVCKTRDLPEGTVSHSRCCVEGPVFPAEAVIW